MIRYISLCCLLLAVSCKHPKPHEEKTAKVDSMLLGNKAQEQASSFDKFKPYVLESGIIVYQYSGDYNGRQTVYFKDHGRLLRVEDEYTIVNSPMKNKVSRLFIQTADKYYDLDLRAKKGFFVMRNDSTENLQGNLLADFSTIGIDSTMRKNGYHRTGDTTISQKVCQRYSSKDGKSEFCFWNGLNIKTAMRYGDKVHYKLEAAQVQEKADIPDDKFLPPNDVKIMTYKAFVRSETKDKL